MVAPYSGPIVKGQSTPAYYWYRSGYRQAKPFTDVLSLTYYNGKISSGLGNPDFGGSGAGVAYGPTAWADSYANVLARTGNKARDRFSGGIQSRVNLSVDLAEYHQSVQMIANRAKQLADVVHAVRKKDFGKLLNALDPRGQKAIRGRKPSWSKSAANNFLETHFGWVPLIGDIHDAAHAISQPLNTSHMKSSSSEAISWDSNSDSGNGFFSRDSGRGRITTRVSAYVKCNNPALHLASSLGITNPAALAWELIPFSFVVDWFANVGQFVSQLDEFAGLDLVHPCTTVFRTQTGERSVGNPFWSPPVQSYTWSNTCVTRTAGLPPVRLVLSPLKLPSATRAVTAVSLLIQQLKHL